MFHDLHTDIIPAIFYNPLYEVTAQYHFHFRNIVISKSGLFKVNCIVLDVRKHLIYASYAEHVVRT